MGKNLISFLLFLSCLSTLFAKNDCHIIGEKLNALSTKIKATRSEMALDAAMKSGNGNLLQLEEQAKNERYQLAEEVLSANKVSINPAWRDAIWKAHRTTAGEKGKITIAQLLLKRRILKEAGITDSAIDILLRKGVCGEMEEQVFLDWIAEAPAFSKTRDERMLVFADWLSDRGEVMRAEMIRIQLARKELEHNNSFSPSLEDREKNVRAKLISGAEAPIMPTNPTATDYLKIAKWAEDHGDTLLATYIRTRLNGQLPPTTNLNEFFFFLPPSQQAVAAHLFWIQFELSLRPKFELRTALEREQKVLRALLPTDPNAPKVDHSSSNEELLAFAKWLEGKGDPIRAELIRVQLKLEDPKTKDRTELERRSEELQEEVKLGIIYGSPPAYTKFVFRRGLVVEADLSGWRESPGFSEGTHLLPEVLVKKIPEIKKISYLPKEAETEKKINSELRSQPAETTTFEIEDDRSIKLPTAPKKGFFQKEKAHITFDITSDSTRQKLIEVAGVADQTKSPSYSHPGPIIFGLYSADGKLVRRFVLINNRPNGRASFYIPKSVTDELPVGKYSVRLWE